jgi:hypothetical protein
MERQRVELQDAQRADLRALVATIDRGMAYVPSQLATDETRAATSLLLGSWAELVKSLALGAAPEVRECPVCKHSGMRAATRCGYCWTKLSPPTSGDGERRRKFTADLGEEQS